MLVVSLTTIRSRLERLDAILESLLQQRRPPDAIVLSVSHEPYLLDEGVQASDLEPRVPAIGRDERIHVRFVQNMGSYRKILAALDDRGSVLHRQLRRRVREIYWDYVKARKHHDSAA